MVWSVIRKARLPLRVRAFSWNRSAKSADRGVGGAAKAAADMVGDIDTVGGVLAFAFISSMKGSQTLGSGVGSGGLEVS